MKIQKILLGLSIILLLIIPTVTSANTYLFLNSERQDVVLITGFEPFMDYEINPSQIIAETLNATHINEAEIIGIVLPVNYNESIDILKQAIEQSNPVLVISVGLAADRDEINIEKIGINLKQIPFGQKWYYIQRISKKGPCLRITDLPIKTIVREIEQNNISVKQSFFAGAYVCNYVYYLTLDHIKRNNLQTKAVFIHVPLLKSQDPQGMHLEDMTKAVKTTITFFLENT